VRAGNALALINDILDVSRVEAGKLELAPTDIYLLTFLNTIANLIRVRADAKNLRFVYAADTNLPSSSWPTRSGFGRYCSTCWATRSSSPRRDR
jgi:signal transduction histidine kinase